MYFSIPAKLSPGWPIMASPRVDVYLGMHASIQAIGEAKPMARLAENSTCQVPAGSDDAGGGSKVND
jgi:hypothetical protein